MSEPTSDRPLDRGGDWRWRVYPLALIAAVLGSVAIVVTGAGGGRSSFEDLGGDLPAFYAAGAIVRAGDGDELFDLARQTEEQARYWSDGGVLIFAYPPAFAVPYAVMAALDYRVAYALHSAFMFAALLLAWRLACGLLPLLSEPRHRLAGLAAAVVFPPMFVGTFLGQNTSLLLLGLCVVWWSLTTGRDLAAGLAAGLLTLKPQYGLPLLALVLSTRRPRVLLGAAAAAAGVWAASAWVAGAGWIGRWLDMVGSLSEVDRGANIANEVSVLGLAESLLGAGSSAARAVWLVASAAIGLFTLSRLSAGGPQDPVAIALLPPALLLIAPHALYYDAGILLLTLGVLLPLVPVRWRGWLLAGWGLIGASRYLGEALGVQPVAALVVGALGWAGWTALRSEPLEPGTGVVVRR